MRRFRLWPTLVCFLTLSLLLSRGPVATADMDRSCARRFASFELVAPLRRDYPARMVQSGPLRPLESIGQLRVATYNIGDAFRGVDQDPGRFQKVVKTIREMNPDILVLEEAPHPTELARLVRQNPELARWYSVGVQGNDQHSQIAFLVKRNLPLEFSVLSFRNQPWVNPATGTQGLLFTRDAPALLVHLPGQKDPAFIVMGTHNKAQVHTRKDPFSAGRRNAQIEGQGRIIEYLQRLYRNVPVIQAGDFNADLGGPDFEPLRRAGVSGMKDVFQTLPRPPSPGDDVTKVYIPERGYPIAERLDGVFVSSQHSDLVKDARVFKYHDAKGREKPLPATREEQKEDPSDHRPVFVDLLFEKILRRFNRAGTSASSLTIPAHP